MNKYVIFYHTKCTDGFGARWAVHKLLEPLGIEPTYVPINWYSDIQVPLLAGCKVFFFDICPSNKELLFDIKEVAESLEVHDHHRTTSDNFGELDFVHIDMAHSGAILAWNRMIQEVEKITGEKLSDEEREPPLLLRYVEAGDLWKSDTLPDTPYFTSMIQSYPYDIEIWNNINDNGVDQYIDYEGKIIHRADVSRIQERIMPNAYPIELDGVKMYAVASPIHPSAIGNMLAEKGHIGLVYIVNGRTKSIQCSLRSIGDDPDHNVATIAGKYGGGGHKNAAGFTVNIDSEEGRTILGL